MKWTPLCQHILSLFSFKKYFFDGTNPTTLTVSTALRNLSKYCVLASFSFFKPIDFFNLRISIHARLFTSVEPSRLAGVAHFDGSDFAAKFGYFGVLG